MWPSRYWSPRYWSARYWGKVGATKIVETPTDVDALTVRSVHSLTMSSIRLEIGVKSVSFDSLTVRSVS